MQAVVRVLLTLILVVTAGLLSYDLARYYLYSPWTRDARVQAIGGGATEVRGSRGHGGPPVTRDITQLER